MSSRFCSRASKLEFINLTVDERKFICKKNAWATFSPNRICDNCHAPNPRKSCTCCFLAKYCSRECQLAHWPTHKNMSKCVTLISTECAMKVIEDVRRKGWSILYHRTGNVPVAIDATGQLYEPVSEQNITFPDDPKMRALLLPSAP